MTEFWKDKRVLVTGHTGFKGSWLSLMLMQLGAQVTGFSLAPPSSPNLFSLVDLSRDMNSIIGDIRDFSSLQDTFMQARPQVVFHLAAQPLVLEGYQNPLYTYHTNVMGTANLLECIRLSDTVRSVVNITTDKVYQNMEWERSYIEKDTLNGNDPYSNSKSCSELITHCYRQSYLAKTEVAVSTARAGNVIGGGDFAPNRILPDCIRATLNGQTIQVRNPKSIRPYQHVLDPLNAYLLIAQRQWEQPSLSTCYNVGPNDVDCLTTGDLVNLFVKAWGNGANWKVHSEENAPHEATLLSLDCAKIKNSLGWYPVWQAKTAVCQTVEWTKAWQAGTNPRQICLHQIQNFTKQRRQENELIF